MSQTTSKQPTGSPLPQEEIAALLPSATQHGGQHAPPLILNKKPLLPQLLNTGGPLPPLTPTNRPYCPPTTIMPVFFNF